MAQQTFTLRLNRRRWLLLLVMLIALYVLVPQFGDFRSSWQVLSHPRILPLVEAIILTFATFAAAAGTYCFLAFRPLRYGRTLLVQMAANFVDRLLPAGIGALGANYLYLRHERHSAPQAGSAVVMNNLLGFIGHILLVSVLVAFAHNSLEAVQWHGPEVATMLKIVGVLIILLILIATLVGGGRLTRALSGAKRQLFSYRQRPYALLGALGTSLILTTCNVLSLFCCLQALGIHLPFVTVLVAFSIGLGAGSAVLTPGGLGGFEAGLAAGLAAYGIDAPTALAAALLYRLVSYWLPMLTGAGAFVICGHKQLFSVRTAKPAA